MEIRVRLPRIHAGLLSNLIGLFSLAAVAVAVGGLTHNWWWSTLVGGVFGVVIAYVANLNSTAQTAAAPDRVREVGVPERPLRSA